MKDFLKISDTRQKQNLDRNVQNVHENQNFVFNKVDGVLKKSFRIIGIDPGTATTGFSILDHDNGKFILRDYGCIKTQAGLPANIRLQQIAEDLSTLITKWHPQYASIEKLFFQKNVKTAMSVSEARGVILHTFTNFNLQITEFTPMEIKCAVCGYGKADKKMIQQMVKIILGLKVSPKPDDAADAIAGAICLANSLALKQATFA